MSKPEGTCPCKYCEHNKDQQCTCQPCQWLREQYGEDFHKEAK